MHIPDCSLECWWKAKPGAGTQSNQIHLWIIIIFSLLLFSWHQLLLMQVSQHPALWEHPGCCKLKGAVFQVIPETHSMNKTYNVGRVRGWCPISHRCGEAEALLSTPFRHCLQGCWSLVGPRYYLTYHVPLTHCYASNSQLLALFWAKWWRITGWVGQIHIPEVHCSKWVIWISCFSTGITQEVCTDSC